MRSKSIIMTLSLIFFFSSFTPVASDVISPEFKRTLRKYGYPEQVYKAERMIKKEMQARGTCLTAFEAKIGRKSDGHLDRSTFLQWQRHKKFKKTSAYRQRHPFVEYEWGDNRKIYYPLRITPRNTQIILPLDSPTNKVLVAWNMEKISPNSSGWKVIYGYENSSDLSLKKIQPLEKPEGYYGAVLYSPPGRVMHFRLVRLGSNDREFAAELPSSLSYKELAQRGIIPKEIWHKYKDSSCQAIIKKGKNIEFVQ